MKQLLLLLLCISFSTIYSQTVVIPDANFKNALLNYNPPIDTNNDNEIQVSEAANVINLFSLSNKNISDLTGIEAFVNLSGLRVSGNPLTSVDISANVLLTFFDANNCPLTSLDVSNNPLLETLYSSNGNVTNLDISNNPALTNLSFDNNAISSLDLSNNPLLTSVSLHNNELTVIDVSNNPALTYFNCESNNISALDVSNNPLLVNLRFGFNPIAEIDLSNNDLIEELHCQATLIYELDLNNMQNLLWIVCDGNPNLTYINIKNGNNDNYYLGEGSFYDLPNLQIVCVDDINSEFTNSINLTGHPVTFTDNCDIIPELSNQISGQVTFDLDVNGCDASDPPLTQIMIVSDNGVDSFKTFTQNDGSYVLYTSDGDFTTSITTNLPSYFTVNPASQVSNFVGFNNSDVADYCVVANQAVNDVNVSLFPISIARPGFANAYQIVYSNIGTDVMSGTITLTYDNNSLSFTNTSEPIITQTSNSISFDYNNLYPFQTRTIDLESLVNAPPIVNNGDILNFTVTINPTVGDYTEDDNSFDLEQMTVGSFDPNDIVVLEGDEIPIEDTSKYLHYIIRFQNVGTASAINVTVNNQLDDKLDWDTMQLLSSSHTHRVSITNGNQVAFIFEGINLPDSTTNEALSNGYIAYRIKPKSTIAIGDIIFNEADIYFDFNAPITTNLASTEIVDILSTDEHTFNKVTIYPNPTSSIVNVASKAAISNLEVFNNLGVLVLSNSNKNNIDLSSLSQGIYFIKIKDINGHSILKKIVRK